MNTISRILFLTLLLCSTLTHAQTLVVWKKHPDYIEARPSGDGHKNNHPATLKIDTTARLLSQIKIKNSGYAPNQSLWRTKDSTVQLFTEQEIDLLSHKLTEGLQKISESQMLSFSVSDYRSSFIGKKRLSISGSAFVRDGRLHLIIGEAYIDLTTQRSKAGITGNYGRQPNTLSTGDFTVQNHKDWSLVQFDGSKAVNGRDDWLSVDFTKDYDYIFPESSTAKSPKYLTPEQKEISNKKLSERISKLEIQQSNAKQHINSQPSTLESRLKALKSLHDKGLLPEAAYLEKLRSIMQEL